MHTYIAKNAGHGELCSCQPQMIDIILRNAYSEHHATILKVRRVVLTNHCIHTMLSHSIHTTLASKAQYVGSVQFLMDPLKVRAIQ